MVDIDKFEEKIRLVVLELMEEADRNIHIEIDSEHINKSIKIKSSLTKTFK
ncbi:MAG: hypothetical protein JXN64_06345 [Spirochaetes bacterium]|nr:hypothetical protein [Spirochaetota bacterium]